MSVTLGGLQVFIRDDTERFTAGFRAAANVVDQQAGRMSKSVQGVSSSVERMNRSAAGFEPNAFRALAISALRAEDNVKRLEAAMLAVSALAGGFAGAFVIRGLVQAADEYRNIQNRISTVAKTEIERVAVNEQIFDIAQRSRTEYGATAALFGRISTGTEKLGASTAEVLRVVETVQKSFSIAGSTTQEAQSAAIQLAQGLASGRLQGDELKSILENNIPLARLLARELAGGDIGKLRDMGTAGELDPVAVFRAIQRGSGEIDAAFEKTESTVRQALLGISNALTKYVGNADNTYGATRILVSGLNSLATNFDAIANSAILLGAALIGIFASNRIVSAATASGRAAGGFFARQREEIEKLRTTAQELKNDLLRTSFSGTGSAQSDRDLALAGQANALKAISREEEKIKSLQEGRVALQNKLASITANTARITEAAAKRREAAENKIRDLENARVALFDKQNAPAGPTDPSKATGFFRAAFDVTQTRDVYERARAEAEVAKATAARYKETMQLVGAEQALAGQARVVAVNASPVLNAAKAVAARNEAGRALMVAERAFAAEEEKIQQQRLSAADRFAVQDAAISQKIAAERTRIGNIAIAEQNAVAKKEEAAEKARVAVRAQIATADAALASTAAGIIARKNDVQNAISSSLITNMGNAAAATALVAAKSKEADDALKRLADASSLAGRAKATLTAAAGSFVAFLGGPWGAALTAANVALAVFGASALAEAERFRRARAIIDEANAKGAAAGDKAADTRAFRTDEAARVSAVKEVGVQVQKDKEALAFLINGLAETVYNSGAVNAASQSTAIKTLTADFLNGTISVDRYKNELLQLNLAPPIVDKINSRFKTFGEAIGEGIGALKTLGDELRKVRAEQEKKLDKDAGVELGRDLINKQTPDPRQFFTPPPQLTNSLDLITSTALDYKGIIQAVATDVANVGFEINKGFENGLPVLQKYDELINNSRTAVNNYVQDYTERLERGLPVLQSYTEQINNSQTAWNNLLQDFAANLSAINAQTLSYIDALGGVATAIANLNADIQAAQGDLATRRILERAAPLGQVPGGPPPELQQAALAKTAEEIVARAAGTAAQRIKDRTEAIYEANRASGASIEWAKKTAEAEYAATVQKKAGAAASRSAASEAKTQANAYKTIVSNIREKTSEARLELESIGQSKRSQYEATIVLEAYNAAAEKGIAITAAKALEIQKEASAYANVKVQLDNVKAAIAAADEVRSTLGSTLGGFFNDIAAGTSLVDSLRNAFVSLRTAILNALANKAIAALLGGQGTPFNFFGLFGGGLSAPGQFSGVYHSGGGVGSHRAGRMMPAAAFANAPKFHSGRSGLRGDELTAILKRNETVLTSRQTNSAINLIDGLARTGGTSSKPTIENHFHGVAGDQTIHKIAKQASIESLHEYDRKVAPRSSANRSFRNGG
jgi:tape measure domain-containing protein